MVALLKKVGRWFGLRDRKPTLYLAHPCREGEMDYDALCDDVVRRYPTVLAHLAE